MKCTTYLAVAAAGAGLCSSVPARADPPSFDRPGIAFSTGVVPAGGFSFEQGLPDFETTRDAGIRTTSYAADTTLRVGLIDPLELQVATALFNRQKISGGGAHQTDSGRGDTRVGLKAALPSAWDAFSVASLFSVTLATGEKPFTNDHTQYDLGAAMTFELDDGPSLGLYVDGTRLDGENSLVVSPSVAFDLGETVGAYVEAGEYRNGGAPNSAVAGAGLTWMATPILQLDASADFGLDSHSPDIAGGIGFSLFIQ